MGFSLEKTWHKFIAFGVVGLMASFIDWLFFNISYFLTEIFIFSVGIGWVGSMIFNFTANRNITFNARWHPIPKQMMKWALIYAVAFLARIGTGELVLIMLEENPFNVNIAYFAGVIVMIPISFFGSFLWVFKKDR